MLSSILFFVCLVSASFCIKLPDYIKPCYRDDPNLNECVKKNLQDLAPKFFEGLPEFGLPTLDPLKFSIDPIEFNQGNNFNGRLTVKKTTSHVYKDLRFLAVRTDLKNPRQFKMDIDFIVPSWKLEGDYEGLARIILYNINGTGFYNVTGVNARNTWLLRGERVGDLMDIKVFTMRSQLENITLYASNLITGNQLLQDRILRFLNNNLEMLFQRLSSYFEIAFDKTFRPFANKVFMSVPYDQLFPIGYKNDTTSVETESSSTSSVSSGSELPSDVVFTTTEAQELVDVVVEEESESSDSTAKLSKYSINLLSNPSKNDLPQFSASEPSVSVTTETSPTSINDGYSPSFSSASDNIDTFRPNSVTETITSTDIDSTVTPLV